MGAYADVVDFVFVIWFYCLFLFGGLSFAECGALAWCFVVWVGWSVGLWICDLIALCIMSMFGFVDCNGLFAVGRGVVWACGVFGLQVVTVSVYGCGSSVVGCLCFRFRYALDFCLLMVVAVAGFY